LIEAESSSSGNDVLDDTGEDAGDEYGEDDGVVNGVEDGVELEEEEVDLNERVEESEEAGDAFGGVGS